MFLVMPTEESHYVWTLVDPSLAIPFSSDTIDTLIPAILLYGSYKITHFLIKHFFLRATGIGCPLNLKNTCYLFRHNIWLIWEKSISWII